MKVQLRSAEIFLHAVITAVICFLGGKLLVIGMLYPSLIILTLCITMIHISIFWKKLKMYPAQARLACYYLEGLSFLVCWATYNSLANIALSKICLIAAIMLPFIGFISSLKTYKNKKKTAI